MEHKGVEQIWFVPNLVALFGTVAVLIWQSIHDKDYARQQHRDCEEKLEAARETIDELQLEIEKLNLLLMGKGGIVIQGGHVDVGRDIVGGDSTVGKDSISGDKTDMYH